MSKKLSLTLSIFISISTYADTAVDNYAEIVDSGDIASSVFIDECREISNEATRKAIADIAKNYDALLKVTDPNCNPSKLAPDLNQSIIQSICSNLEERDAYEFCKVPTKEDETWAVQINNSDIPDRGLLMVLHTASITEQMLRNDCYDKILQKDQNIAHNLASLSAHIQNYVAVTSLLNPAFSTATIAARLASMVLSGVGILVDVVRDTMQSQDPLLFYSKVCGLQNYMANRVRAECLRGCQEEIDKAIAYSEKQMCTYQDAKDEYDYFSEKIQDYSNIIKNITNIENLSTVTERSLVADQYLEDMVLAIAEDRSIMAELLDEASAMDFSKNFYEINDPHNPIRDAIESANPPNTTVARQKQDISLLLGIPGHLINQKLCSASGGELLSKPAFRSAFGFNDSDIVQLCNKIKLYQVCSQNDYWHDTTRDECQKELKSLYESPRYHPLQSIQNQNVHAFLNAIQIQKLTQEVRSNQSSCFTQNYCEQSKYNCIAILSSFEGSYNCQTLSLVTPAAREAKFTKAIQEAKYVDFHRGLFHWDKNRIANDQGYINYLNFSHANKQLNELQDILTTQDIFSDCRQNKTESDCEKELEQMRHAALAVIERCLYHQPGNEDGPTNAFKETNWSDFFGNSQSEGSFSQTTRRILNARSDPWGRDDDPDKSPEEIKQQREKLAQSLCDSMYCLSVKVGESYQRFELFDSTTWDRTINEPFLRDSKNFRRLIQRSCEGEDINNGQCAEYECDGPQGYIAQMNDSINRIIGAHSIIDLNQCRIPNRVFTD